MNIPDNKDDWKLEGRKDATDTAQSECNGGLDLIYRRKIKCLI